jgi:hypothetical protein
VFDPQAFGERLVREMERAGIPDVQTLQRRLAQTTSARGTSYASVWSYVNGRAPAVGPRQDVVDALASILGVLPGYLLAGGPRTPSEAAAEEAARAALRDAQTSDGFFWDAPRAREVQRVLEQAFNGRSDPSATMMLWSLLSSTLPTPQYNKNSAAQQVAADVVRAVLAPLDILGAQRVTGSLRRDYIVGVCLALSPVIEWIGDNPVVSHEGEDDDDEE